MGLKKNFLHSCFNRNHNNLQVNITETDCIKLDPDLDDSELDWYNLGLNLFEKYEKIRGKNSYTNEAEFIETLNHNLKEIDKLSNGDIIKLEGAKILGVVVYHHAAIMISKHFGFLLIIKCVY